MAFLFRLVRLVVCAAFLGGGASFCFAQVNTGKEEKMEESIRQLTRDIIRTKKQKANVFFTFGVTSSYETNAELSQIRKGDLSEEYFCSASINQTLGQGLNLKFNYDLDVIEYNELTDLTSYLNHANIGFHQSIGKAITAGIGADLSYLVYPYGEDGNFIFLKNFAYIRQAISEKMYHQLLFEKGRKYYTNAEAIGGSLDDLQTKKREDDRSSFEYSLGSALTERLFMTLRGRFSINDSNAQFQDYYDYRSYEASSRFYYKLSDHWYFNVGGSYIYWPYTSREITIGGKREKDNIYAGSAGLRYKFNKDNSVSLSYAYRQGLSNDSFATYSGSTMSCGWMYSF